MPRLPDQRQLSSTGRGELPVYSQAAPQWVTCNTVEEICPRRPACDLLWLQRQLLLIEFFFFSFFFFKKSGFPPVLWMPLFNPPGALSLLSPSDLFHSLLDCASVKYFHPKGDFFIIIIFIFFLNQVPFKRDLKPELPPRL